MDDSSTVNLACGTEEDSKLLQSRTETKNTIEKKLEETTLTNNHHGVLVDYVDVALSGTKWDENVVPAQRDDVSTSLHRQGMATAEEWCNRRVGLWKATADTLQLQLLVAAAEQGERSSMLQDANVQIVHLQQRIEALEQRIEALEHDKSTAAQQVAKLEDQVTTLQQQSKKLNEALEQSRSQETREKSTLQQELQEMRHRNRALHERCRALEERYNKPFFEPLERLLGLLTWPFQTVASTFNRNKRAAAKDSDSKTTHHAHDSKRAKFHHDAEE